VKEVGKVQRIYRSYTWGWLGLARWVNYLENPILMMSEKSVELYNLRYIEATREHRMRITILWGEINVTLPVV